MYKALAIFLSLTIYSSASLSQSETRIAATWQVQKYDITAALPQSDADRGMTITAKLDLRNISQAPASTVTLRISPSAAVSGVKAGGTTVDFTKSEERAGVASLQKIVVRVPSVRTGETTSVTVDYKLNIKDNSGVAALSSNTAQFLPLSFWYPTPNSWFFARGADYAPFRIAVNAGSATVLSSGTAGASGAFDQKLRSQPFFVAGEWDSINSGGVSVFLPKGTAPNDQKRAAELAGIAIEARTFISSVLGPGTDVPIRIIAAKRGSGFSGGGAIMVDENVFRRSKIDSLSALSIVEGIAKIWLGGAVSLSGDGEGAIREGLARYLATQFIEAKYGKDVADVERTRQRAAYAAVVTRDAPITQVSPLDDFYYPEVANKGAMVWRLLVRKAGDAAFASAIKSNMLDGSLTLSEIRAAFPDHKEFLDYGFDQVTDINLQAGLPQQTAGAWRVALRNIGSVDATVNVTAVLANNERMTTQSTIRAKSFGEVTFKTANKIARVEIDPEKLYPQTEYSDDVAPREFTENDPLLGVKRLFDKQDYAGAQRVAAAVLREMPRYDDVRILHGRSLLALGRLTDAEREFRSVLDEKLPSARSLAWANVGLADIAARSGQNVQAAKFASDAIRADAEYGASLAARAIRSKLNTGAKTDDAITSFFTQFDRSAAANKKAELEALMAPGEVGKFASGIAGQTEQWKTQVVAVDYLDLNTALVETQLTIKLLNREVESGTAVYRLSKVGSGWKMSAVDIFEVR